MRIELRQLPADAREDAMLRLAAEEAARPFDLARGPLVRATLVHMADDQVCTPRTAEGKAGINQCCRKMKSTAIGAT